MTTIYPSIPIPNKSIPSMYSSLLMARQTINLLTVNAQDPSIPTLTKASQIFATKEHVTKAINNIGTGPPGPAGAKGDPGATGPAGPAGPAGPSGAGYVLPTASTSTLGGVKIDGTSITISGAGVISSTSGGGITDAPNDGTLYGRKSLGWAHLTHTDITDWTASLSGYALTTSVPVASTTTPLMDGTAAVGTGTTWARGDHVHPTDTSRAAASALAGYLPLTGGTLTGPLTMTPNSGVDGAAGTSRSLTSKTSGSPRWELDLGNSTPESGGATGSAGSDFTLTRYNNSGSFIDSPVSILRNSGQMQLTQNLTVGDGFSADAFLVLNPKAGNYGGILAYSGWNERWAIGLQNVPAETGTGNTGSDFTIQNYNDAGGALGTPLVIKRSSGVATFSAAPVAPTLTAGTNTTQLATTAFVTAAVSTATGGGPFVAKAGDTMTGNLTIAPAASGSLIVQPTSGPATVTLKGGSAGNAAVYLNKSGSGQVSTINAQTAGVLRWQMVMGNGVAEGAGNAGSDFTLLSYDNAGSPITTPLVITRASGAATFSSPVKFPSNAVNAATNPNGLDTIQIDGPAGNGLAICSQRAGLLRWRCVLGTGAAEIGSNAGSDFQIQSFTDAGAGIGAPLTITRANGNATFGSSLTVTNSINCAYMGINGAAGSYASLNINKPSSGQANQIIGTTNGSARWQILLGDYAAEGGANSGSNFTLQTFTDANVYLGTPLAITRSTGNVSLTGALNGVNAGFSGNVNANGFGAYASAGAWSQIIMNVTAAGLGRQIVSQTNNNNRWTLLLGSADAESGGNAGSDLQLAAWGDGGGYLSTPFIIKRSNGMVTMSNGLTVSGGLIQVYGNGIIYNNYAPNATVWAWLNSGGFKLFSYIDNVQQGYVTFVSDYRIKKDIAPLTSMWDRVKALNPISYTHKEFTPPALANKADGSPPDPMFVNDDEENWGFIAHELQETLIPTAASCAKDEPDKIQSPNPWTVIATLTKALQEAMARIEALEAKLA